MENCKLKVERDSFKWQIRRRGMARAGAVSLFAIVGLFIMPGCSGAKADVSNSIPRRYECHKATGPIAIDGKITEPAWETATLSTAFVDIEGTHKPAPVHDTHFKMLWDDDYLYVAAMLDDPHVHAKLTQRDAIVFYDNDFEVFIDPNGDEREYYELEFNALNTVFDLFLVRTYLRGGPALHDWNMHGLKSAVFVDGTLNDASDSDNGWSLEIAMPWRSLKEAAGRAAPPRDGHVWRMNFSRVQWYDDIIDGRYRRKPNTRERNWVWSPQGAINMHQPNTWGYVTFRE